MNSALFGKLSTLLLYSVVAVIIYDGWAHRGDNSISAEDGIGYLLGIVGGSLMLIMLLYSLRKRIKFLRNFGNIRYWFRMHMLFGVIGPVMILYHSNFQFGSMNSTVALICMLLVAASGLVGRYLYTQIHHGLYGQKISLAELRNEENLLAKGLINLYPGAELLLMKLKELDEKYIYTSPSLTSAMIQRLTIRFRLYLQYRTLKKQAKSSLLIHAKNKKLTDHQLVEKYAVIKSYLVDYLDKIRKITRISLYERLFSLWHVIHIPFFIMMVLSGITHVIAVHLY